MPAVEISENPKYEGRVEIATNFVDRFLIKELPGANYDGQVWHAPCTWATCVILRGLFGEQLEIGPALMEWSWNEYKRRIEPAMKLRMALKIPDEFMDTEAARTIISWRGSRKFDLREFQEAGVLYLYVAESAGLLDPMGSGKTTQLINLLRLRRELGEDPYPALIVPPNTVKATWRREFALWDPDVDVVVVGGHIGMRRLQIATPADVTVINWDSLRIHSRLAGYGSYALTDNEKKPKELNAIEWKTVIADEAHRARYPKSKQTRALWAVSKGATWKPWATGTPLSDSIDDLWSPLHFMAPDEWPAKTRYLDRFAEKKFNMWGGMDILGIREDTKREFFQILEPRYRRLPKEIILPHLPPKVHMPPYLTEMSAKQRKAYQQMLKHMMTELDDGSLLAAPNPLVRTMRLLQFASAYAEINEDGHVMMASPSCKIDAMEQVIDDLETEQIVFFAENEMLIRLAAERLEKMRIKYGLITGPTAVDLRAENEEAFQAGDLQIILATMGAGREGITLTAAPVLVRMQRSWRTEFNQQSEDRVHRIGSEIHEVVRIVDFVTAGTIEDSQIAVLEGKYGRQQEVVRDREMMKLLLEGQLV
jgi:SNF2 family DNA or RNA helicase